MTDPAGARRLWPRGLPCPDLKAISFTPDGGELATEMESGARRNRQLYDTLPTTYKATMTCDRIETVIFMSFYREVAGAEFEIDVHSPFALVPSLTRHRAQFLALPDISEAGTATWKVSMTLWLAEVSVPDFDDLAFLAAYGGEAGAMVNRFDTLSNVDIPNGLKLRNSLRGSVALHALQVSGDAGTISSGALDLLFPAGPILIGTAQQMSLQARLAELTSTAPWYDPSDLTSLYQARTGVGGVVTAPGQTAGLVLDKSRMGGKTAAQFIADQPTIAHTSATISPDGGGVYTLAASATGRFSFPLASLTAGRWYRVEIEILTGPLFSDFCDTPTVSLPVGQQFYFARRDTYDSTFRFVDVLSSGGSTFRAPVLREIPGFHAIAPSDAARPLYGREPVTGRRNLLTYTEDLSNAAWAKTGVAVVASPHATPSGGVGWQVTGLDAVNDRVEQFSSNTATPGATWRLRVRLRGSGVIRIGLQDASGAGGLDERDVTLTGDWVTHDRVVTFNGSAAGSIRGVLITRTGSSPTVHCGDWQLERDTLGAYQRVTTALDVTEAGVASRHFLQPDGVDDWLQVLPVCNLGEVWSHVGGWNAFGQSGWFFTTSSDGGNGGAFLANSGRLCWRNSAIVNTRIGTDADLRNVPAVCTIEQASTASLSARVNGAAGVAITPANDSAATQGLALFSLTNGAASNGLSGRFYGGAWSAASLPASLRGMLEQHFAAKAGVSI